MIDTKCWWQSKTIWGAILVIASAIISIFGVNVDEQTQAKVLDYIMAIIGAIGGLIAVYGRLVASKRIKSKV